MINEEWIGKDMEAIGTGLMELHWLHLAGGGGLTKTMKSPIQEGAWGSVVGW
jgi:hypothetical protein